MPSTVLSPEFGEGSTLEVNDGSSNAFVAVDGLLTIDPPDWAVIEVDRNPIAVVDVKSRAFSSRLDPGELSFTYEVDYTKHHRLEALKSADKTYRITLGPFGLRYSFTGRLKANDVQTVQGEQINTAAATVRATSVPTMSETQTP